MVMVMVVDIGDMSVAPRKAPHYVIAVARC